MQLFRCGRLEDGQRVGGQVLAEVGSAFPSMARGIGSTFRGYVRRAQPWLPQPRKRSLTEEQARTLLAFGNPLLASDIVTGTAMLARVVAEPEDSVAPDVEHAAPCWSAMAFSLMGARSAARHARSARA